MSKRGILKGFKKDIQKPTYKEGLFGLYDELYEKMANRLARSYVDIVPCDECRFPKVNGLKCTYCGDVPHS